MSSFSIRSSTIRLAIFISTVVIATLIIFQLAWLRKVYRFEEKEFDHSVVKVIRGLYEDLDVTAYNAKPLNELIEKPAPYHYLARIGLPQNPDTLKSYLQYELEDFDIFTSCQWSVYDPATHGFLYTGLLVSPGGNEKVKQTGPLLARNYSYLSLYFPNRRQYILSQMNFWIISSAVLLFVLLLFGASLYYFYRQKFLNETQKDFIHSFAHEFKTPVAVISLAADVLKEPTIKDKPGRLATYADIVEYQARYLNGQVEKLLEFAYTESHHLRLKMEPVDMHELIDAAVHNLAARIAEKKARIIYRLEAAHPYLQADRNYLLIVLTNLLDNALKYAREPVIVISTRSVNGRMLLTIADNGIGIERTEYKRIFKKFYRIRTGETYSAKGFGLGLPFVKMILDAHKGKIKVESEPAQGSAFQVDLPIN